MFLGVSNSTFDQYRPPENYKFPSREFGKDKRKRACQHEWFTVFPWAHYIVEKDAILCYPCAIAHAESKLFFVAYLCFNACQS